MPDSNRTALDNQTLQVIKLRHEYKRLQAAVSLLADRLEVFNTELLGYGYGDESGVGIIEEMRKLSAEEIP